MNLGSYFSNLMLTGLSYELDDTQLHEELAAQEDGPAATKEKKRSINFRVNKLLISCWLNVS
jgi:hypothetical protein